LFEGAADRFGIRGVGVCGDVDAHGLGDGQGETEDPGVKPVGRERDECRRRVGGWRGRWGVQSRLLDGG
jgi:hypothetical protein